jgi:hypothetical protein
MKLRQYPKALEFFIPSSSPSGYGRVFAFSKLVWTETEYNSYVSRYSEKYLVIERLPKWSEVKGKNFLLKCWYVLPNWIIGFFGIIALIISWFHEEILKQIISLFQVHK